MKRKNLILSSLALFTLLLTSCSSTSTSRVCATESGSGAGDYILSCEVTLNKGVISGISLDETFSTMSWANVSSEKAEVLDAVSKKDYTGETKNMTYAKYIRIGDYKFEGSLRDEEEEKKFIRRGEYVKYTCTSETIRDEDPLADLVNYIAVATTGIYNYGNNAKRYYDAIVDGDFAVLDSKNGNDVEGLSYDFPDGKILRSEYDSKWKASIDALINYFVGKKINFSQYVNGANSTQYQTLKAGSNGNWLYNPDYINGDYSGDGFEEITDCKTSVITSQDSLAKYLEAINIAYAASEYDSMK